MSVRYMMRVVCGVAASHALHQLARVLTLLGALALAACATDEARIGGAAGEWPVYGGSEWGDRYSQLDQINRLNVGELRQVWRYDAEPGGLQTSPLMIGGVLYAMTPTQDVIALDAASGKLLWRYDSGAPGEQPVRGLSAWTDGAERRLFTSHGVYLIALDMATGEPIDGFGEHGKLDLRQDLGRDPDTLATYLTSPGVVYRDLIIVGFRTSETRPAAPGAVRAYDVRTGERRWTFNLIPRPGERGYETWPLEVWRTAGGANAWAGMVLDKTRGIVYVPTGSAVDDFYGADRKGDNLYANSLVALDANTGRRLWHFQGVHHDILDRDFASPPALLTVKHGRKRIDAVAQPSKQGFVFVFDRVTGEPLFPIEERPVSISDVPGEQSSTTQPFPLKPAPFARQTLTADMLTRRTPEAHAAAREAFSRMRSDGPFAALTVGKQTVVFPGFDGGAEWGGAAVDRERGVIYINSNDIAWTGGLIETSPSADRGGAVYQQHCAVCHGVEREGAPPAFPRLVGISSRLADSEIARVIIEGKGRMPGFPHLQGLDLEPLLAFLRDSPERPQREVSAPAPAPSDQPKYRFTAYRKFLDPDGYPAVAPPWGTLNAIDLNTGEYLWTEPLGEYPELTAKGMVPTGTENYGGPIVTAGGLVIIGATIYDRKIRAFDSRSGRLLWHADLPFAGVATPITYMAGGRQFIVIATSGQREAKGPQGSAYVAFALPARARSAP
jgi:quinoprotein glucose dehydrogenase